MSADDGARGAWSLRERADGIGVLALDVPGDRLNLLSNRVFGELESAAADAGRRRWKGLLVVSAKPDGPNHERTGVSRPSTTPAIVGWMPVARNPAHTITPGTR